MKYKNIHYYKKLFNFNNYLMSNIFIKIIKIRKKIQFVLILYFTILLKIFYQKYLIVINNYSILIINKHIKNNKLLFNQLLNNNDI